jgi:hypothetical protein
MKKFFVFMLFSLLSLAAFCQKYRDSIFQKKGYLFKEFSKGKVLFKNGAILSYRLNYNTNNDGITFIQDDQFLALTNFSDIDTIYLNGKKFVPIDEKFYYVATTTSSPLLISYLNKPRPIVATTDFNGTSKQSKNNVSNTISDYYVNDGFKDNYAVEFERNYWIRISDKLYKANTENQFFKIYPSKRETIKDFVQKNHIDFSKEEDIVKLAIFCDK